MPDLCLTTKQSKTELNNFIFVFLVKESSNPQICNKEVSEYCDMYALVLSWHDFVLIKSCNIKTRNLCTYCSSNSVTCKYFHISDCGPLLNPDNGVVNTAGGTKYLDEVTYSCNSGYDLVGQANRVCQASSSSEAVGIWSGTEPSCTKKSMQDRELQC